MKVEVQRSRVYGLKKNNVTVCGLPRRPAIEDKLCREADAVGNLREESFSRTRQCSLQAGWSGGHQKIRPRPTLIVMGAQADNGNGKTRRDAQDTSKGLPRQRWNQMVQKIDDLSCPVQSQGPRRYG